jgi:ABC-type transport system involved in cytochrome bd biosynthesis fused ATPase/permease subunit
VDKNVDGSPADATYADFHRNHKGNDKTMAEVSCRKVVKNYEGGVQAVKGIDLEIADQEFVVLVGPSGCGKSTTYRPAIATSPWCFRTTPCIHI